MIELGSEQGGQLLPALQGAPGWVLALYLVLTFLVGCMHYPEGRKAVAVAFRLVARLVCVRFRNSPGTWHVPLQRQPPPDPPPPSAASTRLPGVVRLVPNR